MFERGLDIPQILQINATVIAGVLILMTVGSFNQPNHFLVTWNLTFRTINQCVAVAIIPLVVSCLSAIVLGYGTDSEKAVQRLGTITYGTMIAGFTYLIIPVFLILIS